MKDDTISRAAALTAICEDGTQLERQGQYSMTMAERKQRDTDILSALPSAQPECEDAATCTKYEQVECEDAVSRESVLDEIHRYMEERDYTIGLLHDNVCGLPPVTLKQPGWIPWDIGRFPEESGTYTVTAYDGATKRVTYAKYQKRLKRWELTGARAYWRVLAWMPLPTPYREGGQHD